MASPIIMEFYKNNNATVLKQVKSRVEQGTKATNPLGLNERRGTVHYKGEKINPKSAGNTLFFVTEDSRWKPLGESLRGGIKDFEYAKMLLEQRRRDFDSVKALQENFETVQQVEEAQRGAVGDVSQLELTAFESKVLELNTLLQQLLSSANVEDVPSASLPDIRNILRLFIVILPALQSDEIVNYISIVQELIPSLQEEGSASGRALLDFTQRLLNFLKSYLEFIQSSRSFREKSRFIRDELSRLFRAVPRETAEERKISEAEAERPSQDRRPAQSLMPPEQAPEEAIASLTGSIAPIVERDLEVPGELEEVLPSDSASAPAPAPAPASASASVKQQLLTLNRAINTRGFRSNAEQLWNLLHSQNRDLSARTVAQLTTSNANKIKALSDEEARDILRRFSR